MNSNNNGNNGSNGGTSSTSLFSSVLEMLKEDGVYSLTRVLPTIGYLAFIVTSVYMIVTGKTWTHYTEWAAATGGSVLVQLANKFINSKYNNNSNNNNGNGNKP